MRESTTKGISRIVRDGLIAILLLNIVLFCFAFFDTDNRDEANIGSFETEDFNDGWKLLYKGDTTDDLSLPMYVNAEKGEEVVGCSRNDWRMFNFGLPDFGLLDL